MFLDLLKEFGVGGGGKFEERQKQRAFQACRYLLTSLTRLNLLRICSSSTKYSLNKMKCYHYIHQYKSLFIIIILLFIPDTGSMDRVCRSFLDLFVLTLEVPVLSPFSLFYETHAKLSSVLFFLYAKHSYHVYAFICDCIFK